MPKIYDELASWWPLLSPPADYEEEAGIYTRTLAEASARPLRTMLELGSGGGNNASHLKSRFEMVLVEPSAGMRAVSRALNPECEHVDGDMRTVRLGREFDSIFVHDAVCYMTTESDLRMAIKTAFLHCRPGGAALFAPDFVRENLRPSTDHGGSDEDSRGLRYLEWTWDLTRQIRRMWPITPTCSGRRMERCASNTTGTSRVCSRVRAGSVCCRRPGSRRAACRSNIPIWNPGPMKYLWQANQACERL